MRYLIWLLAAVVAIAAFALGRALDLPSGIVLLITFIGAMIGTAGATWLVQRLLGDRLAKQQPPRPAPRSRGSGRRAR